VDDPDLPLIQALQLGDDTALNELISHHREPLFHFAFRVLRDESAARDVVQETFVRAYFGAAKFRPRATVKTWLYAIALNLSRDFIRRRMRRCETFSMYATAVLVAGEEALDGAPHVNDAAGKRDEFAVLQQAIERLPQRLREALVVFALEGKSQREAANILGTTPKTVELRVYHAKTKLRQWLKEFEMEEDLLKDRNASERLKL
jgi:RNA polymerase sigma factor (sigma-70 family)